MNKSDSLLVRAAKARDVDQLLHLSEIAGAGMTSMPVNRQTWIEKLARSDTDFHCEEPQKSDDTYFMVLEDLHANKIVGCAAVYVGIGLQKPFYSYKLTTIAAASERLGLTIHTRLLSLVNDFTGTTEIGSLFLLSEYRRDGIGKFLSRSRFLLLADFPQRFNDTIFAELRGWLDENNNSPFWDHLGRRFFGISFQEADFISAVDGFQFISDLMPKYPVYLDLLPKEAQEVVGKPQDATVGAFNILQKEGFQYSGYVDIFDAGPTVQTQLTQIKTIADSRPVFLGMILTDSDAVAKESYIASNCCLKDYRVLRTPLVLVEDDQVAISESAAALLKLKVGDLMRIVKEHPASD